MTMIIGLTGGIACGKTTVTDIFRKLGVPVIDADEVSRRLTGPQGRRCLKSPLPSAPT